jgi:hypothetical protein
MWTLPPQQVHESTAITVKRHNNTISLPFYCFGLITAAKKKKPSNSLFFVLCLLEINPFSLKIFDAV